MDEKGATFLADLLATKVEPNGRPGPPPSMYLIILSGGIPGAMLRIAPGINRLGRGSDNSLQVPDGTVSRHHATIHTDADGLAWVTDLGSTNGTFHNNVRLEPQRPTALGDGDRLRFGQNVVVKFARPDPCEERFQREMFERTVRDPLTGLYNRAFFLDGLAPLARHAATRGLGLAILMLDIDHFKRVNDDHGHPAGDQVLRETAAVLRQATRPEDLVARYGGEEFIAALPFASPDQAADRAEQVRRAIAARRVVVNEQALRVTASIGLAFSGPSRPHASFPLIAAADRFLYQAKHAGRDRVVAGCHPAGPLPESQTTHDGEGSFGSADDLAAVVALSSCDLGAVDEHR